MAYEAIYISLGNEIPYEQLCNQYGSVVHVLQQAPELSFCLVLPKDWKQITEPRAAMLGTDDFIRVAAFVGPSEMSVEVFTTSLPWEINLVDWLEFQAYLKDLTMLNLVSGVTDSGQTIHAVAQAPDGAFLRLMVSANGPQIVWLIGRMTENSPDIAEEILGLAVASFEFVNPCGRKTREALQTFTDRDHRFQLLYPESWSYQPLDALRPEKAGVDIRATSESDTLCYLRIEADSRIPRDKTGLEKLHQITLEEIKEAGVVLKNLDPLPTEAGSNESGRWLGTCALPSGEGQIALLFRPTPSGWLSIVMICPDKLVNPLAWMRGKRAYEFAVASLSVPAIDQMA